MEFYDVISTRRSVRSYDGKEVSDEIIEGIIRAAMMAPSAGNQQPWHFIVVQNKEKMGAVKSFHPYAGMLSRAPVSIVVCGDPEGKKWPDFWPQDCSAAVQNMLLASRDRGVGTVWVGIYPLEERMQGMRKLFQIPAHIEPFAIVALGWPEKEFRPVERFNPALVHQQTW